MIKRLLLTVFLMIPTLAWGTDKPINFYSVEPVANTSGYLSIPDSVDWNFDNWSTAHNTDNPGFNGEMTVDFWFYAISSANFYTLISQVDNEGTGSGPGPFTGGSFEIYFDANRMVHANIWGNYAILAPVEGPVSLNTWHHVALVRHNNAIKFYVDGISTQNATEWYMNDCVQPLYIGAIRMDIGGLGRYATGYIDELRISKGVARWTSNFTPPTSAYSTDEYTKLLLHFNNNVTDDSGQNHIVTNTGVGFSNSIYKFGWYSARFGSVQNDNVNKPINFYSRTE